jgi:hypothetical protein
VYRGLVEHFLECGSAAFNKITVKATNSLLVWGRWDDYSRVVAVECVVEPEEITVSAFDLELRLLVSLGSGLGSDRVDDVRTSQIADFVRIANVNLESRLGSLLNANTRLVAAPDSAWLRSFDRWRCARSLWAIIFLVINMVRIRRSSLLLLLRHGGTNHHLLLLRRHRRGILSGTIVFGDGAEGTKRIIDSFETCGLSDQATGSSRRTRGG